MEKSKLEDQIAFCYWCGKEFDPTVPYFAEKHMKRFPWHIHYGQEPKE
jgi:hypothetical protein